VDDARAFLGGTPDEKMDSPDICAYGLKGQAMKLVAVNYMVSAAAPKVFEMNRHGIESTKGLAKDEPGLGATAFSASMKSSISIFLLKANATIQITASVDEPNPIAATLQVKLRDVAKKAAARM
jgi:hypothetical protein